MQDQVERTQAPLAEPRWDVPRGYAWMLLAILPLWVLAFVFLNLLAPGGPPPAPKTLAEAADQYSDVSTFGWIVWTVFASGILVLTALAILWLGRTVREFHRGRVAMWLGVVAMVAGVLDSIVNAYMAIGLKLSDPPSYPPLVEQFALDVEKAKVWAAPLTIALATATIAAVAALLWREKVLGRAALVIAALAGLFFLVGLVVPVPMLPAVLLAILGVVVLRSRDTRYSPPRSLTNG